MSHVSSTFNMSQVRDIRIFNKQPNEEQKSIERKSAQLSIVNTNIVNIFFVW